MSEVHYNFSANNSSLDDVSSLVTTCRGFARISATFFTLLGIVAVTQQQAQDQQDAMKALHAQQASDF